MPDARRHARHGSSGAHRTLQCPGWVNLSAALPRMDSEASVEGTLAHEALHKYLTAARLHSPDPDIQAAVEMVIDWLDGIGISRPGQCVVHSEVPLVFPQNIVPPEDAAGIADLIVHDPVEREVWAIEFKYGMDPVSEVRNPQNLFNLCSFVWDKVPVSKVHSVVIQPRVTWMPAVRTHTMDFLDLVAFRAEMIAAIEKAETDAQLVPGKHCHYCPAETICEVRSRSALAVLDSGVTDVRDLRPAGLPPVSSIPLDRLIYISDHAEEIRSWLKAADRMLHSMAMEGRDVPGRKLVEAQARRRFAGEQEENAKKLADIARYALLPGDFLETKLKGITEIERLLVKAARANAPKGMADQWAQDAKKAMAFVTTKDSSGELSLVASSDPRPAVNRIASAFAGVSVPPPE